MRFGPLLFIILMLGGFVDSSAVFAETDSRVVNISFSVEPVFATKVAAVSGGRILSLGPIMPDREIQANTLRVEVISNMERRYRVYHRLSGNIMNADGSRVPHEAFLFKVSSGEKKGATHVPDFVPVPAGETAIFSSAGGGQADLFTVDYTVKNDELYAPGNYRGDLDIEARAE